MDLSKSAPIHPAHQKWLNQRCTRSFINHNYVQLLCIPSFSEDYRPVCLSFLIYIYRRHRLDIYLKLILRPLRPNDNFWAFCLSKMHPVVRVTNSCGVKLRYLLSWTVNTCWLISLRKTDLFFEKHSIQCTVRIMAVSCSNELGGWLEP